MKIIRLYTFMALGWVAVAIFTPIIILASLAGHRAACDAMRLWSHSTLWLMRTICGLDFRLVGVENIPAEPCVVFMKHSSVYETLVQQILFPSQCWVLKRELMWLPFFGWAVATLKPIAIDRRGGSKAVKQVIKQGIKRLTAGITIIIFPEGTRMPIGETRRYGISGTLLAQEAQVKILPIAHDAGLFWPKQSYGIEPGVATFVIGKPIDPSERKPREVNEEIQIWIQNEMHKLDA